jgi:peptidoglycan/LPS O-acetylase OafA/YrhL
VATADAVRHVAVPTSERRRTRWRHVDGLDGLRALAVVAVLLFHGGYLQGGFLGVDLFFALSGFLITSLLVRDADGGGIHLTAFWGRRFRRLLPAVLALIAVVAAWVAAFGSPAELDSVRRDGPWALGYLANWHAIAESGGYWQSFDQPSMFDHLWSLAIEEQFYLVWPVVLAVVWRWAPRPSRALVTTCVAGIALSLVTMVVLAGPSDPTRVYMGTDTRAASLLAGALAATAPCRRLLARLLERVDATALVVAVGALVLWTWVAVDGASSALLYRGGLALHSGLCALVVAVVATAPRAAGARVLGCRPLAWIGVMSYGLYLWHWPVYVALSPERTGLAGPPLLVLRMAVSVAFAVASFQLVEDPVRRRAAWTRGQAALPALAAAVLLVATVLAVLPAPATEIAAFDPASVAAAAPATTAVPTTAGATLPTTAPSPATSAPVTSPPVAQSAAPPLLPAIEHAVWTGDSIAWDMAPGIDAALTAADVDIDVNAAFIGLRLGHPDKFTDLTEAVRVRLETDGADTIIMQLSVWDATLDPTEQAALLAGLRDLVLGHGARLVVVRPPVVADESTNAGVATMTAAAEAMSAADPTHVVVLDPSAVWGPTAVLDIDGDGTPERKRDLTHVCPSGAAHFGAWLAGALASRFADVTPAPPEQWASGSWVRDGRYDQPTGTCAPVG